MSWVDSTEIDELYDIQRKYYELVGKVYNSIPKTIDSAPKDRPILAWCDHEADPYYVEIEEAFMDIEDDFFAQKINKTKLTLYAAHADGLSHAPTGWHIIEWGGGWSDSYEDGGGWLPDWWFVVGSEFEQAANPTHWVELPEKP